MPKYSYRDPATGVLKAWGYIAANEPGDVQQIEPDSFALSPGKWQWDGAKWAPFVPPAVASPLAQALDAALTGGTPTLAQIKAVFQTWRANLNG